MKKFFSCLLAALLLLFFLSCGKKGPIQVPLVLIPQAVEVFKAFQRGDKAVLEWINPEAYIDGRPLAGISDVEIWVFAEVNSAVKEEPAISPEEFEKRARLAAAVKKEEFSAFQKRKEKEKKAPEFQYFYRLTAEDIAASRLVFALRVRDEKNKKSDFSSLLTVKPQALPLPPANVQAAIFEDRIEVKWEAPRKNLDNSSPPIIKGYNIYRAEGESALQLLNSSPVQETRFEDKDFLFGKTYRYFVRASASEAEPFSESDDAAMLEILTKDVFAPAPPLGLSAIASASLVTLAWEANKEKDLAGYRIWRKEEGREEFIILTPQPILENTFTDTAVEKNKRYDYAITALDSSRNESEKSEAVSEIIKDGL